MNATINGFSGLDIKQLIWNLLFNNETHIFCIKYDQFILLYSLSKGQINRIKVLHVMITLQLLLLTVSKLYTLIIQTRDHLMLSAVIPHSSLSNDF